MKLTTWIFIICGSIYSSACIDLLPQLGYRIDTELKKNVDIDECALGIHDCGSNQVCVNQVGSFTCRPKCPPERPFYYRSSCNTCEEGFYIMKNKCEDLDECKVIPNYCKQYKERCEMRPRKSICTHFCSGNTIEMNQICYDVDECATRANNCSAEERCLNQFGTYNCEKVNCPENSHYSKSSELCVCNKGFEENLVANKCTDINDVDECLRPEACGNHGKCTNTLGSYLCQCDKGFFFNNVTCVDVDECSSKSDVCKGFFCVNEVGTFRCECISGFRFTKEFKCQDINECIENPNVCGENSIKVRSLTCVNLIGSYTCMDLSCAPEYEVIRDIGKVRCNLKREKEICSYSDQSQCVRQLARHREANLVEIIMSQRDLSSVTQFVGSVFLRGVDYDQLHSEIEFVTSSSHLDPQIVTVTMSEDDKYLWIYLTRDLLPSTEIEFDIFVKLSLDSRSRYFARSRFRVFATSLKPNYGPANNL